MSTTEAPQEPATGTAITKASANLKSREYLVEAWEVRPGDRIRLPHETRLHEAREVRWRYTTDDSAKSISFRFISRRGFSLPRLAKVVLSESSWR